MFVQQATTLAHLKLILLSLYRQPTNCSRCAREAIAGWDGRLVRCRYVACPWRDVRKSFWRAPDSLGASCILNQQTSGYVEVEKLASRGTPCAHSVGVTCAHRYICTCTMRARRRNVLYWSVMVVPCPSTHTYICMVYISTHSTLLQRH